MRIILLSLGLLCVALAFIGIFIPGIPTTPFLIVALWAFAQSSKKFHAWLLNHKRFGTVLRNWESHKVVPIKAKITMVILQITAVAMIQYSLNNIFITISLAVLLLCVAFYVISLPSKVINES